MTMNLVPYTWNGHSINDWNGATGTWAGQFPPGSRGNLQSTAVYSPVAYAFPKLSSTTIDGHYLTMNFESHGSSHTISYLRQQLEGWFDVNDHNPHQLIALDIDDSNRQWYVSGIPVQFSEVATSQYTVVLALDTPVWHVVTQSTTGTIAVVASPNSQTLTVLGNVPAQPVITITPTSPRTGTYLYKRYIALYNPSSKAIPFNVSAVDLTGGGLNTGALVSGGKALASAADFHVYVNGVDTYKWFGTSGNAVWNAAATKVWANVPMSAGQVGTLLTSLPNNGTTVDVAFVNNTANKAVLAKYAAAANAVFVIDSEVFTYSTSSVDVGNCVIHSCLRAQKGTSFAAHNAGALIYWVEKDIWFVYGYASAVALVNDDTQKPLIDLGNSANGSWVFSTYYDANYARPAAWVPQIVSSLTNKLAKHRITTWYAGNQGADANPASELGMYMQAYIHGAVKKAESAFLMWSFSHPAGFTNIAMSGSKYAYDTSVWPASAGIFVSTDNKHWTQIWNEAVPGAQSWTAFNHNSALGATYNYLQLRFHGSIAAKNPNYAYMQGDTVTITLAAGLTVSMGPEIADYHTTSTITNTTSGESLTLDIPGLLNQTITLDCSAKTCTLSDGTNLFNCVTLSPNRRNADWLNIGQDTNGNFTGTATLVYAEAGVAGENLTYTWRDSSY